MNGECLFVEDGRELQYNCNWQHHRQSVGGRHHYSNLEATHPPPMLFHGHLANCTKFSRTFQLSTGLCENSTERTVI